MPTSGLHIHSMHSTDSHTSTPYTYHTHPYADHTLTCMLQIHTHAHHTHHTQTHRHLEHVKDLELFGHSPIAWEAKARRPLDSSVPEPVT